MYRCAEPTIHTLSPRGRRMLLGTGFVASILSILPLAWGVSVALGPSPRVGLVAGALALAVLNAWMLVRPTIRLLSTRLELHPGGAAVLAQGAHRLQLHASVVKEVRYEPSTGRGVWLLDGGGRLLMTIPSELMKREAVDAWLEDHIGGRLRGAASDRLGAAGLTEHDAERFWTRFARLAVVSTLAGAPAFASWIAGPSWNRAGVALLVACLACSARMLVRHRLIACFEAERRAGLFALAAVPVVGLAMNACLNLRATIDRPRLALVSAPVAGLLMLAVYPLLRPGAQAPRGMRRALAACVLALAPSLAQLADTLFDPFSPLATVGGVMGAESHGRDRVLFVRFAFEGREHQTLFAPPFRSGFHAEQNELVNVTVGRGLLGVPYVREVSEWSLTKH